MIDYKCDFKGIFWNFVDLNNLCLININFVYLGKLVYYKEKRRGKKLILIVGKC